MLNLSPQLDKKAQEVKEYDIPSFFGDIREKNLKSEIKEEVLQSFLDTEIVTRANNITEPETVDFSESLNQMFANFSEKQEVEETEEHSATNTIDMMLSNYERSSQKQTELEKIVADAQNQAKRIISEAQDEAQQIKADTRKLAYEEGYKDGFDEGTKTGYDTAYSDTQNKISKDSEELLESVKREIDALQEQREDIFKAQTGEMRDLAIAIAEKVINVSLKSSSDVIEKMVLSATEKIKNVQWAKLYVSQYDFDVKVVADAKILNAIRKVTDNIKIEIMENKPSGTCILELPDQIIDASVEAQIGQVKTILGKL